MEPKTIQTGQDLRSRKSRGNNNIMNAKDVLRNDQICSYLEVERFTTTGQMEGCYCSNFNRYLPNGMVAMMYCCTYEITRNCWLNLADQ